MTNNTTKKYIRFFVTVFALSIPFWILGAVAQDFTKVLPLKLPISAIMAFCPLLAAVILIYKEHKIQGVQTLLKGAFDFKKIRDKKWYVAIVFLMPVMALLSYWYFKFTAIVKPEPHLSLATIFIFSLYILLVQLAKKWVGVAMLLIHYKTGTAH